MARRIALVGVGKIARDQHVPALAASPEWELAATVSRNAGVEGVEGFRDLETFLDARPDVEVVSLCLPPVPRFAHAQAALEAGRHVMLEKPPGATLGEVAELERLAREAGVTLYTTWHSRMARAVEAARDWLSTRTVMCAHITWREDVRHWHPGQHWVFEPGGFGVFDPGINALSILTHILPEPVHVTSAELDIPANCFTPIAARLSFSGGISADFDWRQEGEQTWDMDFDTDDGQMSLRHGGNEIWIEGERVTGSDSIGGEYPALYARMAELVATGAREVDLAPMVHVADALMLGRRQVVAPFVP
ncbi:MAG: Gfo/Idh/MocA family oxidoreductase [Rubellimicrobium sp.]|nr:Gfo/Idh/MocA family oxidoreductase [Rubellimicrobium sp.]